MPAFGPSADASQYGENLKKQRGPGPVADSSQAYEEESDLVKGLKVLGSQSGKGMVGPATGKTSIENKGFSMTAEPGSGAAYINEAVGKQTTPHGGDPMAQDWAMMGQPAAGGDIVPSYDQSLAAPTPALAPDNQAQPADITPETMPEPVTVDPSMDLNKAQIPGNRVMGAMGLGLATDLENLQSQASTDDLLESKAITSDPQASQIVEEKARSGEQMTLPEKIAWIGMLVAPVAMGFALRGEKGAYLGGLAAGRGLESLGKSLTEEEDLKAKLENQRVLKEMDNQGKKEVAAERAKEKGMEYSVAAGKNVEIGGKPVVANIYAPKIPGGPSFVEPLMYQGKQVGALSYDENTGLLRSQLPSLKPEQTAVSTPTQDGGQVVEVPAKEFYYKAPEGAKTLADELRDIGIPLSVVSNPEWLKMSRSEGTSAELKQGIDRVPNDSKKRTAFFTAGLDKIIADKQESDRKKEEKVAEAQKDTTKKWNDRVYEQVKAEYNDKAGPISILKNSLNTTRSSMDAGAQIQNDKFDSQGNAEGVRQTKILYAFIKAEDPTTAVREGEIDLARSASPMMAKLGNYWNKLVRGDLMPKQTVDAMEKALQARQIINYANAYNAIKKIKEKADRFGIPHETFTDTYVESMISKAPQDYTRMNMPNADKYKTDEQFQREVFVKLPVGGIFIYKGTPYMKTDVFDANGKETGRYTSTSLLD